MHGKSFFLDISQWQIEKEMAYSPFAFLNLKKMRSFTACNFYLTPLRLLTYSLIIEIYKACDQILFVDLSYSQSIKWEVKPIFIIKGHEYSSR